MATNQREEFVFQLANRSGSHQADYIFVTPFVCKGSGGVLAIGVDQAASTTDDNIDRVQARWYR